MARSHVPSSARSAGALLLALAFTSGQALAATHCANPQEQALFEVQALKSELMVLATDCHTSADYNAFIQRYRPELISTDHRLDGWFSHAYGRSAQQAHDAFITALANSQADAAQAIGSDFCPRNAVLYHEVMALPSAAELPAYAAGKNLIPSSLGTCEAPAVVTKAAAHHVLRGTKRHKR